MLRALHAYVIQVEDERDCLKLQMRRPKVIFLMLSRMLRPGSGVGREASVMLAKNPPLTTI
jgi:hypothetical protein